MSSQSDQSSSELSNHSTPQHFKIKPSNNLLPSFLAGFAGGSASTILLYPLDLIKVRLQVDERSTRQSPSDPQNARGRTICTSIRGVIKHEGYLGLYKGLTPAVIGSAVSWGGFFILYEELKRQILHRKEILAESDVNSPILIESYDMSKDMHVDEEMDVNSNQRTYKQKISAPPPKVQLGPIEHFTASCMAGACMVAITNPIWLIKTRLQLQNFRLQDQLLNPNNAKSIKPPYLGLCHAAVTIVREEGFLALYKGSIPALMLVSHGGVQFVSYEFLKSRFARPEWKKSSGKKGGTIVERLRDSFGYLLMGAASKM